MSCEITLGRRLRHSGLRARWKLGQSEAQVRPQVAVLIVAHRWFIGGRVLNNPDALKSLVESILFLLDFV